METSRVCQISIVRIYSRFSRVSLLLVTIGTISGQGSIGIHKGDLSLQSLGIFIDFDAKLPCFSVVNS